MRIRAAAADKSKGREKSCELKDVKCLLSTIGFSHVRASPKSRPEATIPCESCSDLVATRNRGKSTELTSHQNGLRGQRSQHSVRSSSFELWTDPSCTRPTSFPRKTRRRKAKFEQFQCSVVSVPFRRSPTPVWFRAQRKCPKHLQQFHFTYDYDFWITSTALFTLSWNGRCSRFYSAFVINASWSSAVQFRVSMCRP